ncbi:MAG: TlpA disulfide reductase family protein [bacterium]|nr:TlpA disulfide reductase family protein [bacterium]
MKELVFILALVIIILVGVLLIPGFDTEETAGPVGEEIGMEEVSRVGDTTGAADEVEDANTKQVQMDTQSLKLSGGIFDMEFVDYDGNAVHLSDLSGKPLVVNSWAKWCPFCVRELPDFASVQEELGDSVVFVAINRQESLSKAKGYTDDLGLTDKMIFWRDPDDRFYKNLGHPSMPQTLFIKRDGTINFHKRGVMTREEVLGQARALLN